MKVALFLISLFLLFGCEDLFVKRDEKARLEMIRQQEEELRPLREEDKRKIATEQRARDCNRAFLSFEKAQASGDSRDAVALYHDGLKLCPDDDVAHYELGRILAAAGNSQEARAEFEAALKINPNFQSAKQELEKINRR
jgi:tetratricopeptide (TPR) repeat protein